MRTAQPRLSRFPGINTRSLLPLARHCAGFFCANGFGLLRYFRHCYLRRFSHVDISYESCAVLHDETGAEDIAFDLGAFDQRDHAVTVDVSDKLSFNDDGAGMDVCQDPTLFAHREMPADSSPLITSVGPMTDAFFDRIGCVCPIFGADAMSGLSLSSDFLNIAIFSSACVSEMTLPAGL